MADPTDANLDAALERGRKARLDEPRALSARYDRPSGRIVVELANGCAFAFPPALVAGLDAADEAGLAGVEVIGSGYGLHWEALDIDLSIPGLLAGAFGTARHMARLAGRTRSPAKAAAARVNGARGGRPRKVAATS